MSAALDDLATKWFDLCDKLTDGADGNVPVPLFLQAKMRLEKRVNASTAASLEMLRKKKPNDQISQSEAIKKFSEVLGTDYQPANESSVCSELEAIITEIEAYGLPPAETGDEVHDVNSYRQYHGLDKALAYLLHSLVVEEPGDPVQAMIEKMDKLPKLAALRCKYPNLPYYDVLHPKS